MGDHDPPTAARRPVRSRWRWTWFAGIVAGGAILAVGGIGIVDARQDQAAMRGARAQLIEAAGHLRSGHLDLASEAVRAAVVQADGVLGDGWARHAFMRTIGSADRALLRQEIEDAIAALEARLVARAAAVTRVSSVLDRIRRAQWISELNALDAELAAMESPTVDDRVAIDAARAESAARRRTFDADLRRNLDALAAWTPELESAEGVAAFRELADRVLPAPMRGQDAGAFRAFSGRAAMGWSRAQASLLDRYEAQGRTARGLRAVEALRVRMAEDPDLVRIANATNASRLAALRADMDARIARLTARELAQADLELALEAGLPGAVAGAARRARVDDAPDAAVSAPPVLNALVQGVLAAAERNDWTAAQDLTDQVRHGTQAWLDADPSVREALDRAVERIDRQVDRGLWERFRQAPTPQAARRYLDGWPGRIRRMSPVAREWLAHADAPLDVWIDEVTWGSTGAPPPGRSVEDRPDADLMLRDGSRIIDRGRVVDVVEDAVTPVARSADAMEPGRIDGPADRLVRLSCVIRVDLRDAVAADPMALGVADRTPLLLMADRGAALRAQDPAWGGRPHLVRVRAMPHGAPVLTPYPTDSP